MLRVYVASRVYDLLLHGGGSRVTLKTNQARAKCRRFDWISERTTGADEQAR